MRHSLEVAHAVDYMIETFEPDMELIQRDIGIVAGLLHDIGKTKLYDYSGNALMARFLVEHDHLTLEVCAPALSWLDRVMPEGAMALRHIWTCASPGARYGVQPKMTLARYVRDADGKSALADNERLAFSRHPDGGLVKGGRIFIGGGVICRMTPR